MGKDRQKRYFYKVNLENIAIFIIYNSTLLKYQKWALAHFFLEHLKKKGKNVK